MRYGLRADNLLEDWICSVDREVGLAVLAWLTRMVVDPVREATDHYTQDGRVIWSSYVADADTFVTYHVDHVALVVTINTIVSAAS